MEDIYNETFFINDDYMSIIETNWKKVYDFAVKYIKDSKNNSAVADLKKLEYIIQILVKYGDVTEDVVLKTAIYFFIAKNYSFDISSVKESLPVVEGVGLLIKDSDNLSDILNNPNYLYLNKVVLADLIANLKSSKNSSDVLDNVKLSNKRQNILEKYKNACHNGLILLLQEQ